MSNKEENQNMQDLEHKARDKAEADIKDSNINEPNINESASYTITKSRKYGLNFKNILLGAASIIAGAVGINIFMSQASPKNEAQTVQIPDTDKSKVAIVDEKEKENRDKVNIRQADDALKNGQSMQGEIYLQSTNNPTAQLPILPNNQPVNYASQTPQIIQPMPSLPALPPISPEEKEIDTKIKAGILQQAQGIIGTQHSGYSNVQYVKSNQNNISNSIQNNITQNNHNNPQTQSIKAETNKKLLFKAGDILYATLITGVNTDDSNNVLAVIYGGAYDQATIIGQVNIAPNNINIQFNQLSPKDRNKKTIAIKAIAIREQDARQGVAENIDNHTFERYSYLFAASMLKAIGTAAQGAAQTTIGLGGTILQTQEKVTEPREIAKQGLGEVGTTMGTEARRKFNRVPTYTIPANQGIGIIFTQDVEEN